MQPADLSTYQPGKSQIQTPTQVIQSERQQFDVDMNNFMMLNGSNHQESITSSAGGPMMRQMNNKQEQQNNNQNDLIKVQNPQQENDSAGFFLTGVNVGNGVQVEEQENESVDPLIRQSQMDQEMVLQASKQIEVEPNYDAYDLICVIDSKKILSTDSCVIVNEKQQSISHLTSNSQVTLRVDSFISSYAKIEALMTHHVQNFLHKPRTDKIFFNIADQYNTPNIGGFNISNFKMRYLNEFIADILNDYEQSFIGAFSKALIVQMQQLGFFKSLDLFISITKFENDSGYSLVQGDDQEELQDDVHDQQHISGDGDVISHPSLIGVRESFSREGRRNHQSSSKKEMSPEYRKHNDLRQSRLSPLNHDSVGKQPLLSGQKKKKQLASGTLPEFKKITDLAGIYSAFTQANLRQRVLSKKTKDQTAAIQSNAVDDVKDDIILIQFKLVNQETEKTLNLFSFVNIPLSKMGDINIQIMHEILIKFKNSSANVSKKDFIPYNKSILTRILAPQLYKENFLLIQHFSKNSVKTHLTQTSQNSSGLFQFIDKIYQEKRIKKKKLNSAESLKVLQNRFSKEVKEIYSILGNFRDGIQSFETYTAQQQSQNPLLQGKGGLKTQCFTLFHQILYFLSLKEEVVSNEGSGLLQNNFLSEEEIQKVIFDKQYMKYLRKKIRTELNSSSSNNSSQPGVAKFTKLQQVQYDCIKSELKEEYEKKNDGSKRGTSTPKVQNVNSSFNSAVSGAGRNQLNPLRSKQAGGKVDKLIGFTEKDRFYEFYLKSAQKAMDIMRHQQMFLGQNPNHLNASSQQTLTQKMEIATNYQTFSNEKLQQQSDSQSQSSFIDKPPLAYNSAITSNYHSSLGTGLKITQPLRSASKKEQRRQQPLFPSTQQRIHQFNESFEQKPSSNQTTRLEPLIVRENIYISGKQGGHLEMIEEKIKNTKVNENLFNQVAFNNIDRKTSASSYSRGISQNNIAKFHKKISNNSSLIQNSANNRFTAAAVGDYTISSLGKQTAELSKIKEFMPLRAQGKLKAHTAQRDTSFNCIHDEFSQKENSQAKYNGPYEGHLYEQKDFKRKPQTAQRQKRIVGASHYNNNGNDLLRQRTNSMSKPVLLKKDSSNFNPIENVIQGESRSNDNGAHIEEDNTQLIEKLKSMES